MEVTVALYGSWSQRILANGWRPMFRVDWSTPQTNPIHGVLCRSAGCRRPAALYAQAVIQVLTPLTYSYSRGIINLVPYLI